MATHTRIPVPASAPFQRRHTPLAAAEQRVPKAEPRPTRHRVSKSDSAATRVMDKPHRSAPSAPLPRVTNKPYLSASSKALPNITKNPRHSTSSKALSSAPDKPHQPSLAAVLRVTKTPLHSASSKSLPRVTNKPYSSASSAALPLFTKKLHHPASSKSAPRVTNELHTSASPAPVHKYSTFRREHSNLPTPLRGTARTLLSLDDDFKRDVQMWIFGHVEAVTRKAKDANRFEYHLRIGGGGEETKVTEGMRSDLSMWIEQDDDEEMWQGCEVKIVVTPASLEKQTTVTEMEVGKAKSEEVECEEVKSEEAKNEAMKNETMKGGEVKNETTKELGSVAEPSVQDEIAEPCAQIAPCKGALAQVPHIEAKVSTASTVAAAEGGKDVTLGAAQKVRLWPRRTSPSLAALMAIAQCSEDSGEAESEEDDCDSIVGLERKTGGAETNSAVGTGSLADGAVRARKISTKHLVQLTEEDEVLADTTVPEQAHNPARLRTQVSKSGHNAQTSTPPRIIHIRYNSMNDAMNDAMSDKSSVHTSVFSHQASATTMSSHASANMAEAQYSQSIDALMLEIDVNVCRYGAATVRLSSLAEPSSSPTDSSDSIGTLDSTLKELPHTNGDLEQLATGATAQSTASKSGGAAHLPSLHRVHVNSDVGNEHTTTTAEYEAQHKPLRGHRLLEGMKLQVKKIPSKARDLVKSTKRFTRTLCGFVPAAIAARNPLAPL